MNEQILNLILTGMNSALSPQFIWGYRSCEETSREQQFLNRTILDIIEVERAATLLVGELMGLKVDEEIFRGEIPQNRDNGFKVAICSEFQETNLKYRVFEINCSGRQNNRNAMLEKMSALVSKIPIPTWIAVNSLAMKKEIIFATVYQIGEMQFSMINHNGKNMYSGEVNLVFTVSLGY